MSVDDSKRSMFIGLPESGKSSFIGAFWHVVESKEIDSLFRVSERPEDRSYLTALRDNFLLCKDNERTKIDHIKEIKLKIQRVDNDSIIDFVFPDLDGEMYRSQFEDRYLSKDYLDGVSKCTSLILFINPERLRKNTSIIEAKSVISVIDALIGINNTDGEKNSSQAQSSTVVENGQNESINSDTIGKDGGVPEAKNIQWNIRMCESQIILVDLLQMISAYLPKPCKIGIVISAWDVIKNSADSSISNLTPDSWIEKFMPLLSQYLISNSEHLPFNVFGISAQGGEYSKEPSKNLELQKKIIPSERLIVQTGTSLSNDITIPLKWLFR